MMKGISSSFLYDKIADLHRKMEEYEKKEKQNQNGEVTPSIMRTQPFQSKFNAPPIAPFTNYNPLANNSNPVYSMVQPGAQTTTSSISTMAPAVPIPIPQTMYQPNSSVWTIPQGQKWVPGQGPGQGGSQQQHQSHQNQLQENGQMAYQGNQGYPVF